MAMMVVVVLRLVLALSTLNYITGSSEVFRPVGGSVQLDIQNPVSKLNTLLWVFNKKNVVKYKKTFKETTLLSHLKDRVEFNNITYSLTLKNLQKNDSGLYVATASGDEVAAVAGYTLSVLDPVEDPVLTHQLIRDTCSITLTCRGHDQHINSSCYKEACEKKEVTSPGGVTLSLSVRGSSIICNHSNPASWKEAVLEMGDLKRPCADGGSVSPSAGVSVCVLKTGLYSITLILMLSNLF